MIGVVAKLKIQEGKEAEFEKVANELAEKVNANEPGCLLYKPMKDKSDPQTYIFMEQYTDQAALEHHGQTDYFKAAGPSLGACLAGAPEISYYDGV